MHDIPGGTVEYHDAIGVSDCADSERLCERDGEVIDTYGAEHFWQCGNPGAIEVDGELLCEDHAGELGYGPKQEEYGYDPDDGLNPTPEACCG
jgi:hypothetical protein